MLILAATLRLWRIPSLPPGLHHDEAFHLLRAQEIARGESLPVYLTGNQGNEPLFAYLSAITVSMLGPTAWAGRLTSAFVGLIGVAATMRAAAELCPRRGLGPLAGFALATLYWHLNFSRFGSQPILAATASAGAMAALWSALRRRSLRGFILTGLCLALGLWAYVAFRLFLFVPLIVGAIALARGGIGASPASPTAATRSAPGATRWLLRGGLIAVGVMLVASAPLALFFLRNPYWFLHRFDDTTRATLGASSPGMAIGRGSLRVLAGLFLEGDGDWKYNLPGRPALDPLQSLLFVAGAVVCLRRWRSPESVTLAAWLAFGLAPSALTELAPQFGRAIAATPALALIVAVGAEGVWTAVGDRRLAWRRAVRGLVVVAFAASAGLAVRDYFGRWARDHGLFTAFDVGLHWMALQLRAAPLDAQLFETPVYRYYPTFEYTLGAQAFRRFKAFNGRACTVMPSVTHTPVAYAILVAEDAATLPALEAAYPRGTRLASQLRGDQPYAVIYQIPAGQSAQVEMETARAVTFGETIRLMGYTLASGEWGAGERLQLAAAWELIQPTEAALKAFVHLVGPPDAEGNSLYAQRDVEPCDNSYPTWQWAPGEIIVETYSLPLPFDLSAGEYSVQVGWYAAAGGERLSAFDERGRAPEDAALLAEVRVSR